METQECLKGVIAARSLHLDTVARSCPPDSNGG